MSTPIRRICSDCCACAASGQATPTPLTILMKSRRLIAFSQGSGQGTHASQRRASLFDNIVGALLEEQRHVEAEVPNHFIAPALRNLAATTARSPDRRANSILLDNERVAL